SGWLLSLVLLVGSACVSPAYSHEPAARPLTAAHFRRAGPETQVDVVYLPDLTYRTARPRELKLDLLLPGRGPGPFPAVILLHGAGPFNKGRKGLLPFAEELARKGYVAAAVSYRCGPDAAFPGPVHDAKCAVRWLRAHAAEYRIDAGRVAVVGWSCGGYLACMVGMTSPADGLEGDSGHLDQPSHVQAVVSYSAPTDLGKWYDDSS